MYCPHQPAAASGQYDLLFCISIAHIISLSSLDIHTADVSRSSVPLQDDGLDRSTVMTTNLEQTKDT